MKDKHLSFSDKRGGGSARKVLLRCILMLVFVENFPRYYAALGRRGCFKVVGHSVFLSVFNFIFLRKDL